MMKWKKGYVRTLEAFIAFIITFSFLIFITATKEHATTPEQAQLFVLRNFEQRPDFRDCVYTNNISCMESMVNSSVPAAYGYHITVNDASYTRGDDLYIDSLYVTGDRAMDRFVVRMYYWKHN